MRYICYATDRTVMQTGSLCTQILFQTKCTIFDSNVPTSFDDEPQGATGFEHTRSTLCNPSDFNKCSSLKLAALCSRNMYENKTKCHAVCKTTAREMNNTAAFMPHCTFCFNANARKRTVTVTHRPISLKSYALVLAVMMPTSISNK